MIVGHSMLAFAVVAGTGAALGWAPRRARRAGIAAAAFALVPDVDMVYGPVAIALVETGGPAVTLDAFWSQMARIHRLGTHFLLTGAVAGPGVAAVAVGLHRRHDRRGLATLTAGVALLLALVAWMAARFAALDAVVVAVYLVAGIGVAVAAVRRLDLDGRAVLAAAAVGLVSHPFGDLFAGEPPRLFYPLAAASPTAPLQPFADPTLDFLLVFGLELATVWCAVGVLRLLTGRPDARHVDGRALLGIPYAVVAFLAPLPAPDVWFYPEFSVLATGGLWLLVGGVGLSARRSWLPVRPVGRLGRRVGGRSVRRGIGELARQNGRPGRWFRFPDGLRDATTGLVAISLAAATYAACYLLVGGQSVVGG